MKTNGIQIYLACVSGRIAVVTLVSLLLVTTYLDFSWATRTTLTGGVVESGPGWCDVGITENRPKADWIYACQVSGGVTLDKGQAVQIGYYVNYFSSIERFEILGN